MTNLTCVRCRCSWRRFWYESESCHIPSMVRQPWWQGEKQITVYTSRGSAELIPSHILDLTVTETPLLLSTKRLLFLYVNGRRVAVPSQLVYSLVQPSCLPRNHLGLALYRYCILRNESKVSTGWLSSSKGDTGRKIGAVLVETLLYVTENPSVLERSLLERYARSDCMVS